MNEITWEEYDSDGLQYKAKIISGRISTNSEVFNTQNIKFFFVKNCVKN